MKPDIEAIFLDVGNTLRIIVEDPKFAQAAKDQLMKMVDSHEPQDEFFEKVEKRWKKYRKQAKERLIDASELELWTQWLLPDYPIELIAPNISKLTRMWRDKDGRRVARDDVKDTVVELHRRGYQLGIIANTITETEIPDWMIEDGVTQYFNTVILSSKVRVRKPDPSIYQLAARVLDIDPSKCVYVGDNPIRDVEGTRAAGYGMMILIEEPATLNKYPDAGNHKPDFTIKEFKELLDIFPARS
jgi:HAD superfamily hydrolase (TIGR01662 family)